MTMLAKDDILRGLRRIDDVARQAGVVIDLSVYGGAAGGAALALVFDLRVMTRDVDAIVRGDPTFLREAAAQVAAEENWSPDWLNDGVKGFVSGNEEMNPMDEFTAVEGEGGLRIFTPSPQYIFAMKCMSMRAEGLEGSHDISDIEVLADVAEIKGVDDALELVEAFYPADRIPAKVRFGVQEIMERVLRRRAEKPPKG